LHSQQTAWKILTGRQQIDTDSEEEEEEEEEEEYREKTDLIRQSWPRSASSRSRRPVRLFPSWRLSPPASARCLDSCLLPMELLHPKRNPNLTRPLRSGTRKKPSCFAHVVLRSGASLFCGFWNCVFLFNLSCTAGAWNVFRVQTSAAVLLRGLAVNVVYLN
jgi:hypothetical protein